MRVFKKHKSMFISLKRQILGIRILLLQDLRTPEIWGLRREPQALNGIKVPVFCSQAGSFLSPCFWPHLSLQAPLSLLRGSKSQLSSGCYLRALSPTTFIPSSHLSEL